MRRRHFALPLLALLAGCGLLYAEVEIPSVTVTLPQQDFTGTPAGAPLVKEVSFDVGANLPFTDQPDVSYELRLTRLLVTIVSGSAMGDFGDIASVTLTVLPPPGQTLPEEATIAAYAKAPPPADQFPTSISVAGYSNLDLAPYVAGNTMTMKLTAVSLTGAAIPAWKADVGGEFYLKARVEYGDQLAKRQ
jgi:hypothetical protein